MLWIEGEEITYNRWALLVARNTSIKTVSELLKSRTGFR